MKTFITKAWAKINLTLDILEKRADGYHNLESVMQTVGLYDTIILEKNFSRGISITTNAADCPANASNLAYKAAERILQGYNVPHGLSIEIRKNIPIAAGLAGGSADCAATLRGCNELFGLKIPNEKLLQIAAELGADVPFCINGGTQLAAGTGTLLTKLPNHPPTTIVLAHLPLKLSTAEIYAAWDTLKYPKERQTATVADAVKSQNVQKIAENLANNLTPVATSAHAEILQLLAAFRNQSSLGASMTGSGPTVFAYFDKEAAAFKAIKNISQEFENCVFYCVEPKN
ncbi:MAG: 4-(cytidine 5'-diphospho)-2-C-methyl-D-erythritol kinase [Defluviitaleaceae bacterium]|nr:4-(cytidine 5'-diphospho)-2-C-methyl-D-erythritol kinase [Defluviitaleaceae bacterium]